jgi:hypothetical protein
MPCTTPICDLTVATTSTISRSNTFAVYPFLALHRHHHHHTSGVATNDMDIQSFLSSSQTLALYGDENDRNSGMLSTCTNAKSRVDRVIAFLDAALEIVGNPSDDVILPYSEELSLVVNDPSSSRIAHSLDVVSDKNDQGRVAPKQ